MRAGALWEGPVVFVWEEPGKQKPRSCRAQEFGPKQCPGNMDRKRTATLLDEDKHEKQFQRQATTEPWPEKQAIAS
jgi:hypothetical protein